jgi:hypothetical protein
MWKVVAGCVIVSALGTGCASEPECTFYRVMDDAIGSPDAPDCGAVYAPLVGEPDDLTPWRDAHNCAIAMAASQRTFSVRWVTSGFEGGTTRALVGRLSGTHYSTVLIEQSGSIPGDRTVAQYACDLSDRGNCDDPVNTLCVDCGPRTVTDQCVVN